MGVDVKVEWSGPSSPEDILFVAPRDLPKYTRPSDLSITVRAEKGESLTIPTPPAAGLWEVRYYSWANETSISSAEFEIVLPEVTLSGPKRISAGSSVDIEFTGRGGPGDIVFWSKPDEPANRYYEYQHEGRQDALEDDIEDGLPLSMVEPVEAGSYEIRFFNEEHGGLLAHHTIEVIPSNIILEVPESVQAGSLFEVEVDGPNALGDTVFLSPTEWEKDTIPADISARYSPSTRSIELHAPRKPGSYEIRYYSWSNGTALVTKQFEVK